tara:strand:+ start:2726 stop:8422 length:5697 start_codon:yes stop_codon:yes gene_type:complete
MNLVLEKKDSKKEIEIEVDGNIYLYVFNKSSNYSLLKKFANDQLEDEDLKNKAKEIYKYIVKYINKNKQHYKENNKGIYVYSKNNKSTSTDILEIIRTKINNNKNSGTVKEEDVKLSFKINDIEIIYYDNLFQSKKQEVSGIYVKHNNQKIHISNIIIAKKYDNIKCLKILTLDNKKSYLVLGTSEQLNSLKKKYEKDTFMSIDSFKVEYHHYYALEKLEDLTQKNKNYKEFIDKLRERLAENFNKIKNISEIEDTKLDTGKEDTEDIELDTDIEDTEEIEYDAQTATSPLDMFNKAKEFIADPNRGIKKFVVYMLKSQGKNLDTNYYIDNYNFYKNNESNKQIYPVFYDKGNDITKNKNYDWCGNFIAYVSNISVSNQAIKYQSTQRLFENFSNKIINQKNTDGKYESINIASMKVGDVITTRRNDQTSGQDTSDVEKGVHIALVYKVEKSSNKVYTIEGNTNGRNIALKTRDLNDIVLVYRGLVPYYSAKAKKQRRQELKKKKAFEKQEKQRREKEEKKLNPDSAKNNLTASEINNELIRTNLGDNFTGIGSIHGYNYLFSNGKVQNIVLADPESDEIEKDWDEIQDKTQFSRIDLIEDLPSEDKTYGHGIKYNHKYTYRFYFDESGINTFDITKGEVFLISDIPRTKITIDSRTDDDGNEISTFIFAKDAPGNFKFELTPYDYELGSRSLKSDEEYNKPKIDPLEPDKDADKDSDDTTPKPDTDTVREDKDFLLIRTDTFEFSVYKKNKGSGKGGFLSQLTRKGKSKTNITSEENKQLFDIVEEHKDDGDPFIERNKKLNELGFKFIRVNQQKGPIYDPENYLAELLSQNNPKNQNLELDKYKIEIIKFRYFKITDKSNPNKGFVYEFDFKPGWFGSDHNIIGGVSKLDPKVSALLAGKLGGVKLGGVTKLEGGFNLLYGRDSKVQNVIIANYYAIDQKNSSERATLSHYKKNKLGKPKDYVKYAQDLQFFIHKTGSIFGSLVRPKTDIDPKTSVYNGTSELGTGKVNVGEYIGFFSYPDLRPGKPEATSVYGITHRNNRSKKEFNGCEVVFKGIQIEKKWSLDDWLKEKSNILKDLEEEHADVVSKANNIYDSLRQLGTINFNKKIFNWDKKNRSAIYIDNNESDTGWRYKDGLSLFIDNIEYGLVYKYVDVNGEIGFNKSRLVIGGDAPKVQTQKIKIENNEVVIKFYLYNSDKLNIKNGGGYNADPKKSKRIFLNYDSYYNIDKYFSGHPAQIVENNKNTQLRRFNNGPDFSLNYVENDATEIVKITWSVKEFGDLLTTLKNNPNRNVGILGDIEGSSPCLFFTTNSTYTDLKPGKGKHIEKIEHKVNRLTNKKSGVSLIKSLNITNDIFSKFITLNSQILGLSNSIGFSINDKLFGIYRTSKKQIPKFKNVNEYIDYLKNTASIPGGFINIKNMKKINKVRFTERSGNKSNLVGGYSLELSNNDKIFIITETFGDMSRSQSASGLSIWLKTHNAPSIRRYKFNDVNEGYWKFDYYYIPSDISYSKGTDHGESIKVIKYGSEEDYDKNLYDYDKHKLGNDIDGIKLFEVPNQLLKATKKGYFEQLKSNVADNKITLNANQNLSDGSKKIKFQFTKSGIKVQNENYKLVLANSKTKKIIKNLEIKSIEKFDNSNAQSLDIKLSNKQVYVIKGSDFNSSLENKLNNEKINKKYFTGYKFNAEEYDSSDTFIIYFGNFAKSEKNKKEKKKKSTTINQLYKKSQGNLNLDKKYKINYKGKNHLIGLNSNGTFSYGNNIYQMFVKNDILIPGLFSSTFNGKKAGWIKVSGLDNPRFDNKNNIFIKIKCSIEQHSFNTKTYEYQKSLNIAKAMLENGSDGVLKSNVINKILDIIIKNPNVKNIGYNGGKGILIGEDINNNKNKMNNAAKHYLFLSRVK